MNHPVNRTRTIPAMALATVMTLASCDDRAAKIAIEAADRQAEQNREMAQLNREVAAGASRLVTEDAKARQQALAVHRDLQQERSGLTDGWNNLEAERKEIAQTRRTDSALAAIASGGGATLAALLALALAWLVLYRGDDADESSTPAIYAEVIDVMLDAPQGSAQLPAEVLQDAAKLLPADAQQSTSQEPL